MTDQLSGATVLITGGTGSFGSTMARRLLAIDTMFKTQVGPVPDEENIAYLPPETAQGMFVNFLNVATTMRRKLPFGMEAFRDPWQSC